MLNCVRSVTADPLGGLKKSDDRAAMEQSDLPPEEWRWQKDGPADRGGSMLSAAAAQCHIQTEPSSGSGLLYLHATAGVTARAKRAQPKTEHTAVSASLLFHLEVVSDWNSFLQALCACVKRCLEHNPPWYSCPFPYSECCLQGLPCFMPLLMYLESCYLRALKFPSQTLYNVSVACA